MGVQMEDKKKKQNKKHSKLNRSLRYLKQINYNIIFRWLFLLGVILNILVLAGIMVLQSKEAQLMNSALQAEYEYDRVQDYWYSTKQNTFQRIMQDQNCNLFKQIKQYIQPINSLDELCQNLYQNM